MSRRMRFLIALLVVSFTFAAAACADATGPRPACETNNPNIQCG